MKRWDQFLELAQLETDECVEWPFGCQGDGYGVVYHDGTPWLTHRKALDLRTPCPDEGLVAAHGPCHNPRCMNYRHLRWASHAENHQDKWRDGTNNHGERHGISKLTDEQARDIKYSPGLLREFAEKYGVCKQTVSDIRRGETWRWL